MKSYQYITFLVTTTLLFSCNSPKQDVQVICKNDDRQLEFAIQQLETALENRQIRMTEPADTTSKPTYRIVLTTLDEKSFSFPDNIKLPETILEEGFSIRKVKESGITTLYVVGGDAAGTMYGGLELAEMIRISGIGDVEEVDQKPYMKMRGIKFNIPLDARTPSYTDVSDAAQENIPEMWSFDFWKECIDNLALHRYNFISLWSMHPFPSMVKVPDYSEIALDDVKRSTVEWDEYYSTNGLGFDTPEIMNNLETLIEISIEEKIAFWQKVMRYAKERNIDFYVVTWNIFTYGTDGKYGITDKIDNPVTVDYFRKSVKQMFLSYPDLAGIGLTTGENMPNVPPAILEKWAFDTYGQGILDAAEEMPGREMTLLHRQHMTGTKKIAEQFQPLLSHPDINFIFSFKYAKAHVHSYTLQPYHQEFVQDIGDMKTIWTLRNDDTFHFRWGAPDFVREFIKNIPLEVSEGWYMGSDQWIWGREFLSKYPGSTREIELSKHWYQWMLWGRLGYNPEITNERFGKILQVAYPEVEADKLLTAWQEASMVYPKTTAFHWGMYDFQWYIEGCKGRPQFTRTRSGFHDVNRFINLPPLESTNYLSIPDYVKNVINKEKSDSISPPELAVQIHGHATKALSLLSEFPPVEKDDLLRTINDIRIIANMGKYYAFKIEGATQLELFRQTNDTTYQIKAIERLERAAEQWRLYASLALEEYKNPLWTNRVGYVNWRELMNEAFNDVVIAGGTPELQSMTDTKGGTILPADKKENIQNVTWTYKAPESGTYYAEIRYACETGIFSTNLTVNDSQTLEFVLWTTGGKSTYGWDRVRIELEKGSNKISLELPENAKIKIEHLNILK